MTERDVLYEDNHIIIVNKKASEIVQVDETGDNPLCDKVGAFLKKKYKKSGNVFVGVTHRLDRPVSGAIIFAKTSKALGRLNKMFQDKKIQKTYWAFTLRQPPKEFDLLQHYLIKDRNKNKTKAHLKQVKDGKFSELEYKVIKRVNGKSLLEINPLTGRPHQIRVQLAFIGCIIKGDLKYGAPTANPDKSVCLHSRHVEFVHPVSKEVISVTAPIHKEELWK
ncbi:MAG: RNA pseudouridine synthase [Lentisphaeraceae bacterium]|nr:RNA pseudouridine synthase [Lentisphaeraceae bacterium]